MVQGKKMAGRGKSNQRGMYVLLSRPGTLGKELRLNTLHKLYSDKLRVFVGHQYYVRYTLGNWIRFHAAFPMQTLQRGEEEGGGGMKGGLARPLLLLNCGDLRLSQASSSPPLAIQKVLIPIDIALLGFIKAKIILLIHRSLDPLKKVPSSTR